MCHRRAAGRVGVRRVWGGPRTHLIWGLVWASSGPRCCGLALSRCDADERCCRLAFSVPHVFLGGRKWPLDAQLAPRTSNGTERRPSPPRNGSSHRDPNAPPRNAKRGLAPTPTRKRPLAPRPHRRMSPAPAPGNAPSSPRSSPQRHNRFAEKAGGCAVVAL
jgi:hypothetical protein